MKHPLPALAALAATGCGESLVSGEALDDLLGLVPEPGEPAWEGRWVSDEGLALGCDLQEIDADFNTDEVVWGNVLLPAPQFGDPPVWNAVKDGEWALVLPVVVDTRSYERLDGSWDSAATRTTDGLWGAPAFMGVLWLRGDIDSVREQLFIDDPEASWIGKEPTWVSVMFELVEVEPEMLGALWPVSEEENAEIQEEGIMVTAADYLDEPLVRMLSGEAFGGAYALPCDEEDR